MGLNILILRCIYYISLKLHYLSNLFFLNKSTNIHSIHILCDDAETSIRRSSQLKGSRAISQAEKRETQDCFATCIQSNIPSFN